VVVLRRQGNLIGWLSLAFAIVSCSAPTPRGGHRA
jgi:hypothetical protein